MAALLGARTLVLDVVARNAGFHEAADQVAHVWIAAVAGVRVGDMNGRKSRAFVAARCASVIRERGMHWLRSAESRARLASLLRLAPG